MNAILPTQASRGAAAASLGDDLQLRSSLSLPDPAVVSSDDLTRVLIMLEGNRAEGSSQCAKAQVESNANLQEKARKMMQQAQQQARKHEVDGSFWDKVGSTLSNIAMIAGAAAAAASVVVSGGASAPVVLALAGAAMSASASVAQSAGCDDKLCNGLRLGGAALSIAGGGVGASAFESGGTVGALRLAQGAARTGQGTALISAGYHHGQAQAFDADALSAKHRVAGADEAQKDQIERLGAIANDASAAISTLIDLQIDAQASAMNVINNFGRRA